MSESRKDIDDRSVFCRLLFLFLLFVFLMVQLGLKQCLILHDWAAYSSNIVLSTVNVSPMLSVFDYRRHSSLSWRVHLRQTFPRRLGRVKSFVMLLGQRPR